MSRRRSSAVAAPLALAVALALPACATIEPRETDAPDAGRARPESSMPATAWTAPPPSSPAESGTAAGAMPYRPAVGVCLDARKDALAGPAAEVPCSSEHDDEAYAAFDLVAEVFAGDAETESAALAGCLDRFAGFIGLPYDASALDVYTFHPTEASWAAGDRSVVCVVWDPSDSVVGSLAGAAY
jgi:hypothetical protein